MVINSEHFMIYICENKYKMSHFKMEATLSCLRNCFSCLIPLTLVKQNKITFGLGLKQPASQITVCQNNKKEDIINGLMATRMKIKIIV